MVRFNLALNQVNIGDLERAVEFTRGLQGILGIHSSDGKDVTLTSVTVLPDETSGYSFMAFGKFSDNTLFSKGYSRVAAIELYQQQMAERSGDGSVY